MLRRHVFHWVDSLKKDALSEKFDSLAEVALKSVNSDLPVSYSSHIHVDKIGARIIPHAASF